jgi:hypothetical protein
VRKTACPMPRPAQYSEWPVSSPCLARARRSHAGTNADFNRAKHAQAPFIVSPQKVRERQAHARERKEMNGDGPRVHVESELFPLCEQCRHTAARRRKTQYCTARARVGPGGGRRELTHNGARVLAEIR